MDEMKFNEQLYRYIDGELDPQEVGEFESFLQANPLAQVQLENEQKFDNVIRRHMIKEEAPYELRERIINQLQKRSFFDKIREAAWFKPLASGLATSLAAVVFLAILLHHPQEFTAFAQGVETHIDQLQGAYTCEILTEDIDEAMAWFTGKLDFALAKPHISPEVATLVGARIIQINGEKAAYFMYEANGKQISAFVMDMEGQPLEQIANYRLKDNEQASVYAKNIKGFEAVLCYHKDNDTGCMFVTDMSQDEFIGLLG